MSILAPYDIVIDGTDNFPTRYLVNDACVLLKKPNVYGSIFRFEGQASVFHPPHGPCYRCLYPEPPPPGEVPSCAEGGVLGILPGLIGCIHGSVLIPLPELPDRFEELDRNREMVVHCKSGMRSQKAIHFLRSQGFQNLKNLKGGILAWADRIDPSMPKY